MSHITTNFKHNIPKLYEQIDNDEIVAFAKYKVPYSDWIWYILEYSTLQNLFYCYVQPEQEYQYVTVDKLLQITYEYGVEIVLDTAFIPTPLKDLV